MINYASDIDTHKNKADDKLSETDLETLRKLLLGPEYQSILKKVQILDDPVLLSKLITPSIQEALRLESPNNSLQKVLTPTIVGAFMDSVSTNPKPIVEALYPVMGPAIRKSINATMNQMMSNFNQLIEQSVSPQALQWRFDAWRTGRSYAEVVLIGNLLFQVEQVFLIHRKTGLLLLHEVAETAISKDPDMVSGMLTAIQDFTNDSFSVEQNSGLNSLKLGDLTVLIENAPHATLAAVVRGTAPREIQELLSETVEEIHLRETKRLINYKGDTSQFLHLRPLLAECLRTQLLDKEKRNTKKGASRNKKLIKYGFLACLLLLAAGIVYQYQQATLKDNEWNHIQRAINSEPGLIITNTSYDNGTYQVAGLADPLAKAPSTLINHGMHSNIKVRLMFKPYLSLDPEIVLKRVSETFDIPDSVQLSLKDKVLILSGRSTKTWLANFEPKVSKISGIKSLDTSKIKVVQ